MYQLLKWINKILRILSRLFVVSGLILSYLATKKMGVLRSMLYRNQKLLDTILAPIMLKIYVVCIVFMFIWIIYKILNRHEYTFKETYILFLTGTVAMGTIYLLQDNLKVGLPLVFIGILLGLVESFIKLIFFD